ncbi:MAG: PAS domain-containing protein [Ramlibacter sp.]|nr:PAS domain-containing protein [Ramlibacter sp.]MCW5651634.1 PAS domain-containing protein [Ramlibacter sp.]
MADTSPLASWFGLRELAAEDSAFVRLWRGFMTARVMIALVLLALLGAMYAIASAPVEGWLILMCGAYLVAALAVRTLASPRIQGHALDAQWMSTIGVDLLVFAALQFMQAGGISYNPLFALPLLLASVLGSLLLALGTAAAITLLLLVDAWLASLHLDTASRFLQAGLTGTGFFIVALLANQLATRLVREEQRARQSQQAARVQIEVNELVIEALSDGVLVVDDNGIVRAANPAAQGLLGSPADRRTTPFVLAAEPAWHPLIELARLTFLRRTAQVADVDISEAALGARRLHVRTRLTATHDAAAESLCVMFLEDLREMEARLRTEKLAAMGRMSAAVAHEIRNPLAAITQANALLDEDLTQPGQKQLTLMVRQNAQRLAQIVEEILDLSRVQHESMARSSPLLDLDAAVSAACTDWGRQTACGERLRVDLHGHGSQVAFEPDHLRRVLVNLLDNALRYASPQAGSIRVSTETTTSGQAGLRVWSDGAQLEQTVQRHLFEPFFSSESRSSGLGLYICRELCERHGALIGYQRATQAGAGRPREGNEFFVTFRQRTPAPALAARFDTIRA